MLKYKKKILILIAVSFVLALTVGGTLLYFIFYSITLPVFISFLWSLIIVKTLSVSQEIKGDYAYVGDTLKIKTIIRNKTIFPALMVEISDEMIRKFTGNTPVKNIIYIRPFGIETIYETSAAKYRGYYSLGPVGVEVTDILGVFTWTKKIECTGEITIYPRIALINSFSLKPVQTFGTITTKNKANEDNTSISDIRKYYHGDSYKRIHWKVSARKASLYVKNYEMGGSSESYVLLNMFNRDYESVYRKDIEEKAVECAEAIVYYMLSKNVNTDLFVNCQENVYIKGRGIQEFESFLDAGVSVKSDGTVPLRELLESRYRLLTGKSYIILVTPALQGEDIDRIIQLKALGFDFIIVYIMIKGTEEEKEKRLYQMGIKLYKIEMSDDIKTSLEG